MSINLVKFAVYALLLGCATYVKPSFALAKLGHQLVCQLAFEQLTAPQQQQVNALLLAIPVKEQQRINRYNGIKKNNPITYASACT